MIKVLNKPDNKFRIFLLLFFCLTSSIITANNVTFCAGISFSKLKYNRNVDYTKSAKVGLNLSIEAKTGPEIVGFNFVQRRSNISDAYMLEMQYTFNYIGFYALHPIKLNDRVSFFAGMQYGKCIAANCTQISNGHSETSKIRSKEFLMDFGVPLGFNIRISDRVGLRASYYIGVTDVAKGIRSEYNFKNRGFVLNLLFK